MRVRIACVYEIVIDDGANIEETADEIAFAVSEYDDRIEICEGAWVDALDVKISGHTIGVVEER